MAQTAGVNVTEAKEVARGGVMSFAGAAFSALMGFALTVVVGRLLGDSGAGVVLQAMGIFMIALSLAKLGMDSAAVWLLPRLARSAPRTLRGALLTMLVPPVLAGALVGIGGVFVTDILWRVPPGNPAPLKSAVQAVLWLLPVGAATMVALSATRGLGGVRAYVLTGNVGLPALRPAAVWMSVVAGAGAVGAAGAWALPFLPALAVALIVLRSQIRRRENGEAGRLLPDRGTTRMVFTFALPRTVSAGLEQSVLWLDVILVGVIAGSAAAGVYGAASRVVMAGLIVDTALRVVISPRFSALLHEGRTRSVQELYSLAATWLMLFSTPIYVLLAVFAPAVLGIFGEEFDAGTASLRILCAGALFALVAGNIHSVLLMSGRSGWAALNKAVVLVVNVAGNLLLIPVMGISGAAVVWAVSMLIDAALASVEVWRFVGVRGDFTRILYVLAMATLCLVPPAAISLWALGNTWISLICAASSGGVVLLLWCVVDRRRLHLTDLSLFSRTR